jgi:predicted phage terminase large subunit-like protein
MSAQEAFDALIRDKYPWFLRRGFQDLSAGTSLGWNWHLDAIAWELDRLRRGESLNLIVTMPPRHLKSIAISIAWVAWMLGHDPGLRFFCVSYNSDLAAKFARDCRKIMQSDWYRRIFPNTILSRSAEMDLVTTLGGGRFTSSIGGTITGRGGDIVIVDDPMKADEANSETARRAVNEWMNQTMITRPDNKLTARKIVVMQRLHEDDVAGVLLAQDDWGHLNLPAIAEEDQQIPIDEGSFHHRNAGDVLHPEREPLDLLLKIKAAMGSAAFSAQYQQAPVPASGNLILREWLRRYMDSLTRRSGDIVVQSWDTASKDGVFNDYSVCITVLIRRDEIYVLEVFRRKMNFPELLQQVGIQANRFGASALLIEDAASGQQLIQTLEASPVKGVPRPIPCKVQGDKITRMSAASYMIEAGQLILPDDAPWSAEFERELLAFPYGKHDDQADALSQLLNWFRERPKIRRISPVMG